MLSVNETTTGNDLTGATVTRIRTLAKFIDAVNFADGTNATADPTAEFPQEVYSIDRKSTETREVVEFELAAPTDLQECGYQNAKQHVLYFLLLVRLFNDLENKALLHAQEKIQKNLWFVAKYKR